MLVAAVRRRPAAVLALAGVCCLFGVRPAAAQSIQVTANRTEVTIEEQVLLSIRVEGARGVDPELPTLEGFTVTPAGQETQVSFVNGRSSSSVKYNFLLTPAQIGTFEIGAASIIVDGKTYSSEPFQIRVLEASATPREERELFVTARVSTTEPFVGQQVIHTWRFYRRVKVAEARLEPPVFEGFLVEDLGEQRDYQATIRGQQYLVSELRRALFPQEDGRLTIRPSQLTVEAFVESQGRRRSPFDDFFSRRSTERRVLREPMLELDVRPLPPAPAGFSGLVGAFDIRAQLTRRELKVGESATLKVTISGKGNSQLIGEPPLPPLPDFKIYADRPSSSLDRDGSELSGSKSFSKALVPLVPGELVIPAIELSYFDPESESFKVARTSAIPLEVAPADGEEDLGLTESLAPTAGKVSVRIVADDILPLYKDLRAAAPPPAATRGWLLAAGLLVPPMLFLAIAAGQRRRQRFARDANLRRRQLAVRAAKKKLERLAAAEDAEAPGLASLCLREFIGDKLGLEGSALTAAEVAEKLDECGVGEETAGSVVGLLERLEAAQYSAASVHGVDARDDLLPVLRKLDKEIRV